MTILSIVTSRFASVCNLLYQIMTFWKWISYYVVNKCRYKRIFQWNKVMCFSLCILKVQKVRTNIYISQKGNKGVHLEQLKSKLKFFFHELSLHFILVLFTLEKLITFSKHKESNILDIRNSVENTHWIVQHLTKESDDFIQLNFGLFI